MTQELGPTVGLVERSRAIPATLWGSTDRERIGVISERDANNTMGRFKCFDFRWFKVLGPISRKAKSFHQPWELQETPSASRLWFELFIVNPAFCAGKWGIDEIHPSTEQKFSAGDGVSIDVKIRCGFQAYPWGTEDEISQAAGGNGAKSVTGTVILFPIEFNEEYLQMSPLFMESGNGSGEESNYWETSYGIFRKWGIEKEGLSLNDGMNAQTNMYDTPELEAVMRITRRLKLRNKLVFDYGYSLIWLFCEA
ncbi:predicted protein [Histoplasma capsulatum G186AR]|uniref:Uncharacterized protein n=1 Tax=Ajellomyces capsulatus (strain G186AR / H82 / ATCC MYA-2454 / RMSCC 2432) TaxID=447093 RepID=C0NM48_AJECG|nr:uncharacterized protein HCBG_04578 [Histoplasma capsulatum G186AR]EEH07699.1 predicted protein [Histoplasma capsulatum G186AR]